MSLVTSSVASPTLGVTQTLKSTQSLAQGEARGKRGGRASARVHTRRRAQLNLGTLGTLYPAVHTYLSWDLEDSGS